jgi:divalent metal cation (Fe/Co/Zn/Cd) transporter
VDQFFGAGDPFRIHGELVIGPPSDCHERASIDAEPESARTIDAYAGAVGGMATAREAMYRHARKVSQYGHGNALRGDDPVTTATAVAITAAVVAFVAFVVGGATGGTVATIGFSIAGVALAAAIIIVILLGVGIIFV